MRQVPHIFKKEFRTYFVSPIAYIVISIFLIVIGWFFFSTFFLFNQAGLRNFFLLLPIVFAFVIPAVTMRLFSEEYHIGSYETLLTMPVTFREVVLGKFLASVAFIAAMLFPTLAYPITVSFLGDLDWGPVVGGYVGALLLGASFAGVGLFASSLTRNQIVAFIIGVAICFALVLVDKILFLVPAVLAGCSNTLGRATTLTTLPKESSTQGTFCIF
jgi:ABC-2 type transport system permease protein